MFRSLMPRETNFFQYFEQHCQLIIEGSREFLALVSDGKTIAAHVQRISEIEKEADHVAHQCIDALHKTFITPFDRADIHQLIKRLDDVIDAVDAATSRMELYELTEMRAEAIKLGEVLVRASSEIYEALKSLRNPGEYQDIQKHCIMVHQMENDGDMILRAALVRLFKETDAVLVIKWKEIFERLEKATDRCEAVVNIIEGIVIEAS